MASIASSAFRFSSASSSLANWQNPRKWENLPLPGLAKDSRAATDSLHFARADFLASPVALS